MQMGLSKLFKKDENFGIVISKNCTFDILNFQDNFELIKLDIDNLWKVNPLTTQADPFLFVKDQYLYLFYEKMRAAERGEICMRKMNLNQEWSEPVEVLKEPFHLSFPYVFEDDGIVYMIPETQETDSIRLYKGNYDLSSFSFERILLFRERYNDICFNFCDSHIFKKDGIYYLFTSVSYNWTYHLELYYSEDLIHGEFIKHPQSPIYIGNDYGRSAGSIIHNDENYYRISQDCQNSYGANISVHRIIHLDKFNYKEELLKTSILKIGSGLYKDGGHQLSIVRFGDNYIYATDYRRVFLSWYQLFLRIKRHLV